MTKEILKEMFFDERFKNVETEPTVRVIDYGSELFVEVNAFRYLSNILEIDDVCKNFNQLKNSERYQNEWIGDGSFYGTKPVQSEWLSEFGFDENKYINTYNFDNLLDTVLQYVTFEKDDKTYILLQVHNGGDVRGNYSYPNLFVLNSDSFPFPMLDVHCKDKIVWTKDSGLIVAGVENALSKSLPVEFKKDVDANIVID